MLNLITSIIKQLFRDKQTIFWSIIFPALFIIIFGLFKFEYPFTAKIIVIDNIKSEETNTVIRQLEYVPGISINTDINDEKVAKQKIQNLDKVEFEHTDPESKQVNKELATPDLIMVMNPGINGAKINIRILHDDSKSDQITSFSVIRLTLENMINQQLLAQNGIQQIVNLTDESLNVKKLKYLDFLVPGVLAMSIMQSMLFGLSTEITSLKERKILKRIKATPLPTWKFLLAEILSRLILTVFQLTIMLLISIFIFKVHIYGNIGLIYLIALFSSFIFLNIAFIISAVAKTTRASEGIAQAISTPMMFLSGVFFARDTLPKFIRIIADYLPLSPLIDAIREIAINSAGILDIKNELLILTVWVIITTILALKFNALKNEG